MITSLIAGNKWKPSTRHGKLAGYFLLVPSLFRDRLRIGKLSKKAPPVWWLNKLIFLGYDNFRSLDRNLSTLFSMELLH